MYNKKVQGFGTNFLMLVKRNKMEQTVPLISSEKQAIAGFFAGFTSTLLTYPLDLLKTRFQSGHFAYYRSSPFAFKSILQNSGFKGLFVGIEISLIGSTVSWGAYFYLYAKIKNLFRYSPNSKLQPQQHLLSSFIAGSLTQIISTPIWVIKTNMQLNERGII